MSRRRTNGEGSLYPASGGWRGYIWVTRPDGIRYRKYVQAATYQEARRKWIALRDEASKGPVVANAPRLADYLASWLSEVVKPNLAPRTYEWYETSARLYVIPYLGAKRLNKLTARDTRRWLNQLRDSCQCCLQEKDARRPEAKRRCCAVGKCCEQKLSAKSVRDARDTLRVALNYAVTEDELISRNVAAMVRLPSSRTRKVRPWSVAEACQFLASARADDDPLYIAYVLMLVLGMRRGETLGLTWPDVRLDTAELDVSWQLQRVNRQLHHRETKTPGSDSSLPLPDICIAAFKQQEEQQQKWRLNAGQAWQVNGLVITTRLGTPYEPRNFNRHYTARCRKAGVRYIKPHALRRTCGSLLAALDVHPRTAMRILRHSKIGITMEIYTEVPDEITRDALRKLGDQLNG